MARRKSKTRMYVYMLLGVLLLGGCFYLFLNWNNIFPSAVAPEETTAPATEISVNVSDYAYPSSLLSELARYNDPDPTMDVIEFDASDLDRASEYEDLVYANFSSKKSSANPDSYSWEPEAGYIYVANISCTGYSEAWAYYGTNASYIPFLSGMQALTLGVNTVYLVNTTSDINLLCHGDDNVSVTTLLNTSERDWSFQWQMDSIYEGVTSDYDQANDRWNGFCIRIGFDTTAATVSWVSVPASEVQPTTRIADGAYVYIFWNGPHVGSGDRDIRFDTTIVTSFNVTNASVCVGSDAAPSSVTVYDSQS